MSWSQGLTCPGNFYEILEIREFYGDDIPLMLLYTACLKVLVFAHMKTKGILTVISNAFNKL